MTTWLEAIAKVVARRKEDDSVEGKNRFRGGFSCFFSLQKLRLPGERVVKYSYNSAITCYKL